MVAPLNAPGDLAGAVWNDGHRHHARRLPGAFRQFAEGGAGWGLTRRPRRCGSGLPHLVGVVLEELLCAANLSFST